MLAKRTDDELHSVGLSRSQLGISGAVADGCPNPSARDKRIQDSIELGNSYHGIYCPALPNGEYRMNESGSQEEVCTFFPLVNPISEEANKLPRHRGWKLGAAFGLAVTIITAGIIFGGEWEHVAFGAWETVPVISLALLAYLGTKWAKVLALVCLAMILLIAGLATLLITLLVVESGVFTQPNPVPSQVRNALIKLALISGGIGGAIMFASAGFFPGVRRSVSRVLPLDPESFVHMVALVIVTALTVLSFVPLLVLAAPPLETLVSIRLAQGEDLTEGRGRAGMLLNELYSLVWLVPATVLAVGYGVRRNFKQALERLGLQRPTRRQVAGGVGLAVVLVVTVGALSPCMDWIWGAMGWPKTDMKSFEKLLTHFFTPLGALVIGVVAGLGEELAVRGVLQPRLGIWLSNLFFTGLHALQYNWDGLLIVFFLGLILGLVRKKSNTTTSAIVHGSYDSLFVMAVVLQIPGFSE